MAFSGVHTEELANRVNPREDVSSNVNYKDDITEAEKAIIAEKVGISILTGANGSDGADLGKFRDTTLAGFTRAHVQKWIYIPTSGVGNAGFYKITGWIDASNVSISPDLAASESGLAWKIHNEPNMEDQENLVMTQLAEIIDPTHGSPIWAQPMPRGFDAADTDAGSVKNEKLSLKVLADNWLGTQTDLQPVIYDNDGASYPVKQGDGTVQVKSDLGYADAADRRGLLIFESAGNTYHDEGAADKYVKVDVIDMVSKEEFLGSNGSVVFGKLIDGADSTYAAVYGKGLNLAALDTSNYNIKVDVDDAGAVEVDVTGDLGVGGSYSLATVISNINAALAGTPAVDVSGQLVITGASEVELQVPSGNDATLQLFGVVEGIVYTYTALGEGTDVQVKLFDASGAYTLDMTGDDPDPTSIFFLLPKRIKWIERDEADGRRQWIGRVLGDAESHEDMQHLWSMLGVADGEVAGDWDWNNTTDFYAFKDDPDTAEDAFNALNDIIGNLTYDENNVVTDGETVTSSINELDKRASGGMVMTKIIYVVPVGTPIPKGTAWTIPFATGSDPSVSTYKMDTGYRGLHMSVDLRGRDLVHDTSAVLDDQQYEEVSNTQIRFWTQVNPGEVVVLRIYDDT